MSKAKHAKINFKPSSSKGRPKQSNEIPIEFIDRDDSVVYQFLTANERKNKATKFPHAASFTQLEALEGVLALFENIR